jgi:hypothetical protein
MGYSGFVPRNGEGLTGELAVPERVTPWPPSGAGAAFVPPTRRAGENDRRLRWSSRRPADRLLTLPTQSGSPGRRCEVPLLTRERSLPSPLSWLDGRLAKTLS